MEEEYEVIGELSPVCLDNKKYINDWLQHEYEEDAVQSSPQQSPQQSSPSSPSSPTEDLFIQPTVCHIPSMIKFQQIYNNYKTAILKDICDQKNLNFKISLIKVANSRK